ncbi:MAG: hypothetical protein NTW74_00280 [Acidobacteria bacterium]|nr:hypothetical protein [Acidobacteriota bacterium]
MQLVLQAGYLGVGFLLIAFPAIFSVSMPLSSSGERMQRGEVLALTFAAIVSTGFLLWSIQAGPVDGNWALALGLAVIGLVLYFLLTLVGVLTLTKVQND